MKKNDVIEIEIDELKFPNNGIGTFAGKKIKVKNAITGQKVKAKVTRSRKDNSEARLIEVMKKADYETKPMCKHFEFCGGCSYQNVPYEKQLQFKSKWLKEIIDSVATMPYEFLPIEGSSQELEYRNKMEFSFGDEEKGGPLSLGIHKRNSFHSIITTDECCLIDEDFRKILSHILSYFQGNGRTFYNKTTNIGFLRYLLVRKTKNEGQILINLITTSQDRLDEKEFTDSILSLDLNGIVRCIAHSINDGVADVARADNMKILHGEDSITEELLGLYFDISSFSFFQTNSLGAKRLYSIVREFIGSTNDKVIFDLYSGTGTIGQILAPSANKVLGIEIVEEAVKKANENARKNKLENCIFIAGDVLKMIDELKDKPDIIVLDPPREGIHPKAIQKIIDYSPDTFIYVSCKMTSLLKDLPMFLNNGYNIKKVKAIDLFPQTPNVETVILLERE